MTKLFVAFLISIAPIAASASRCVYVEKDGAIKLQNADHGYEEFESCEGTLEKLYEEPLYCEAGTIIRTESKTGTVLAYTVYGDSHYVLACVPK